MTSPFLSILAIFMIYVAMFLIFRKLRKRLEELKAQNKGCTKQEISFHQTIGIFKKSFYPDIPGWNDTQIQTLEIRNLDSCSKPMVGNKHLPEKAKRSGSMLKNLAVLASHHIYPLDLDTVHCPRLVRGISSPSGRIDQTQK